MLHLRKGRIVAGRMNKAQNKYLVYMATNTFDDGDEVFTKQNTFKLQDYPAHGSLNLMSLQRLGIFIHHYPSHFERKLDRLT